MEHTDTHRFQRHCDALVAAGLVALVGILHAIPFFRNGIHPFGYDTGFYRRYLIEPFISFPNAPVPGLGSDALVPRLLLDVLRAVQLPPDVILYGTYVLFSILPPVLVYFLLREHVGTRAACISAVLVALSPVQYIAYWYFLWKNAWALCLLLAAFLCIDRRWMYALLVCEIMLALSHKTTAILYLATLVVLFLIDRSRRRDAAVHALATVIPFAAVSFPQLSAALSYRPQAIFIDWTQYVRLSIPFILAILCNPLFFRRSALPRIVIAFAIVTIAFPILHLPFYERVFIFSDIALAILAGCALADLLPRLRFDTFDRRTIASLLVFCIAAGLMLGNLRAQIQIYGPLMTAENIRSIEAIDAQLPQGATLLTTSDEASWFEGWTHAHIAAPGMLRDDHNLEEWIDFWSATSSEQKIAFLGELPHPLYIATLAEFEDLLGSTTISCLERVTPHLYFDACISSVSTGAPQ